MRVFFCAFFFLCWFYCLLPCFFFCFHHSFDSFSLQIAHVCDSLLSGLKGVADKTVIGNDSPDITDGRVVGQLCVITRTNHKQFSETVDAIAKSTHWNANANQPPRPKIFFAGNDKKEMYFKQVRNENVFFVLAVKLSRNVVFYSVTTILSSALRRLLSLGETKGQDPKPTHKKIQPL